MMGEEVVAVILVQRSLGGLGKDGLNATVR